MSAVELEEVLNFLSARIVEYVKNAESTSGTVGKYHDPLTLAKQQTDTAYITNNGEGIDGLKQSTEWLLDNSVVTWHKAFLEKLYAGTNPVGVASDMLLSILNTNSHVFTASPALSVIEKYVGHRYAEMFGFNGPRSGGLTFPGGSYSNITSMQMARSLLFPETKEEGTGCVKLAVFASEHCHYSITKAAIMLGLGSKSVFKVKVNAAGCMEVESLKQQIELSKQQGYKPFYINTTAGTTVYGSFDPFTEISAVAKANNAWMHIDGSWGGNVVFSPKQKFLKLHGSHLADSITVNPHKMLGVPCTCSFLLVPDTRRFQEAHSLAAGYLFHSNVGEGETEEDVNFDLADGTMGCGRRADSLKLYLGWQFYGTDGYANRVDHAFDMTAYLANKVAESPSLTLLSENPPPCLQTCFWYTPVTDVQLTVEQRTKFTREIATKLHKEQKFLVDYAPHPEGEFFRVVLNSPTVDKKLVDELVDSIITAGNDVSKTILN